MPSKFASLVDNPPTEPERYSRTVYKFPTRGVIANYKLEIVSADIVDMHLLPDPITITQPLEIKDPARPRNRHMEKGKVIEHKNDTQQPNNGNIS